MEAAEARYGMEGEGAVYERPGEEGLRWYDGRNLRGEEEAMVLEMLGYISHGNLPHESLLRISY